ncbi:MAG TPA: hypothetical protein VGP68_24050 [Gemmataceae bacterium]|jgi:hypothetical protein|nr:hypothetical protein [Gemmataceae bacterium]
MLEENLVGYLLHALDPDEQRQVERAIQEDPQLRRRLELLEQALQPLAADREHPQPPADLRYRVLAQVAEDRLSQPLRLKAPPLSSEGVGKSWWRRADVLAAAVLLIVVGPLLAPAISYAKSRYQIGQCQNNLRAFHAALMAYSNLHEGRLPRVDKDAPRNVAGVVVPILYQEGLGRGLNVHCPSSQTPDMPVYSLDELEAAYTNHADSFNSIANQLSGGYAYALGYQDAAGQLHGVRIDTVLMDNDLIPVMADRPSFDQTQGVFAETTPNSRNHDAKGQNVLYLGGAVRFVTSPRIGAYGDDIYLNEQNRIAAGLHRLDAVLGASDFKPCPAPPQ